MQSRIFIRLSIELKSEFLSPEGGIPASLRNFSAASLNPSKNTRKMPLQFLWCYLILFNVILAELQFMSKNQPQTMLTGYEVIHNQFIHTASWYMGIALLVASPTLVALQL